MLTLLGLYRLLPRYLRPIIRLLALFFFLAIVIFSVFVFSRVLVNLPTNSQKHVIGKQNPAKEVR